MVQRGESARYESAMRRSARVRMIKKQEDKFEVDPDWVLSTVTDLLPDGGRLDQEVRRLENTYFDTPSAGLRLFGGDAAASGGGLGDGLAVEGFQVDGSD